MASNISKITDLISQSKLTLIGYTFAKEKFLYKIVSDINPIKIGIDSFDFRLGSYIRDRKIDNIIDGVSFNKKIYINLSEISIEYEKDSMSRPKLVNRFVANLRDDALKYDCSVMVSTSLYKNLANTSPSGLKFSSGSQIMYI
jgi:hypothetical protein